MFARAAESFRRVGDASNAANADYNRADVLVRQGRSDEAWPLLQNTLRVARAVGDEELVALVRRKWAGREPRRRCSNRLDLARRGSRSIDQTGRTARSAGRRHCHRGSAFAS